MSKKPKKIPPQPSADFKYLEELMLAQKGPYFRFYGEDFEGKAVAIKNKKTESQLITRIVDSGIPLTANFKNIVQSRNTNAKNSPLPRSIINKATVAPSYERYESKAFESVDATSGIWLLLNKEGISNSKEDEFREISKMGKRKPKVNEINDPFLTPVNSQKRKAKGYKTAEELEQEKLLLQRKAVMLEGKDDEEELEDVATGLIEEERIKFDLDKLENEIKKTSKITNNAKIIGAIKDPNITYEKLRETFKANGNLDIHEYEGFVNDVRDKRGNKFGIPLPPISFMASLGPMDSLGPATSPSPTTSPSPATSPLFTTSPVSIAPAPMALTDPQKALIDMEKLRAASETVVSEDISQDVSPFIAGEAYPDEFEPKYHLVSILILFGSFNPDWDTRMMENIRSLRISKEDLNTRMDNLIIAKGKEMQIEKRLTNGELSEFNEICQCWAVITRNLHTGDRTKQALVSLGQLSSFSNLLNSSTSETVEEVKTEVNPPDPTVGPAPAIEPIKTYEDGQMKPNRPITGPLAESQKVRTYPKPISYPDVGKTLLQINKELADNEKNRFVDTFELDRFVQPIKKSGIQYSGEASVRTSHKMKRKF